MFFPVGYAPLCVPCHHSMTERACRGGNLPPVVVTERACRDDRPRSSVVIARAGVFLYSKLQKST
ncbi:MAG: hypothetical protein FWH14_03380 [Oscillospiraceae bacterium]|nr:hypothetical protein [Oscillospiraceae bacterium]